VIRHIIQDLKPQERILLGHDEKNGNVVIVVQDTKAQIGHCAYVPIEHVQSFTSDLVLVQKINEGLNIIRSRAET